MTVIESLRYLKEEQDTMVLNNPAAKKNCSATTVNNATPILETVKIDGITALVVDCKDRTIYKQLPKVLTYEGIFCGFVNWNNETGKAYYQSNVPLGFTLPIERRRG